MRDGTKGFWGVEQGEGEGGSGLYHLILICQNCTFHRLELGRAEFFGLVVGGGGSRHGYSTGNMKNTGPGVTGGGRDKLDER